MEYVVRNIQRKIRENITPIGDGNLIKFLSITVLSCLIRENITPIGDGNHKLQILAILFYLIRENITPIGDGNLFIIFFVNLCSSLR